LKNDEGVVMVVSRAAHLAQSEEPDAGPPASAGGSSESDDVVRLDGKPKKAKKKRPSNDPDLF
jgi:hypothetical protein